MAYQDTKVYYDGSHYIAIPKTASEASDKIPPTTGTKVEMVTFAAFSAAASVFPLRMPVIPI